MLLQEDEARKYTENSRMVAIQAQLTERALELLVRTQWLLPGLPLCAVPRGSSCSLVAAAGLQ